MPLSKSDSYELNTIYNLDAKKISKIFHEKSIDLVFFDPPYNVGKDYGVYKDELAPEEYMDFMKDVIHDCKKISKRGIGIYLDWKQFKPYWHNLIPEAEPIIIFKRSSGVIYSPLKIVQHHHVILTTATAVKPKLKSLWDDVRVYGEGYLFNEETFDHPAQTSLKATKRFIEYFSEEGDVVFDPFMGVGTTAVACKSLNRNYIGFELNPEYIKRAQTRIRKTKKPKDAKESLDDFLRSE